ncbi:MAG: Mth938-like domain-containing protein [Pseudomonadota bacterium]|nr:Mth938-like domain-containing protein [Pseudomonadota bacterium]
MKLHLDARTGENRVRGYDRTSVRINETTYRRSLLLMPEEIVADWPPATLADLRAEHLEQVAALAPEVVLLGTGARLCFPPPATLAPLHHAGIGVEVMSTDAACRTYNILSGEGRRVLAALLIAEQAAG